MQIQHQNRFRDAMIILGTTAPAFVFTTVAPIYYELDFLSEIFCMLVVVIIIGGTSYNVCRVIRNDRDLISLPGVHPRLKPLFLAIAITMYLGYTGSIAGDITFALQPIIGFNIVPIVAAVCITAFVYGLFKDDGTKNPLLVGAGVLNLFVGIAFLGLMVGSQNLPRIDTITPTFSYTDRFLAQITTFQVFGIGFERFLYERKFARTSVTRIGVTITLVLATLLVLVYEVTPPYMNLIFTTYNVVIPVLVAMLALLFGTVSGVAQTLNSLYIHADLSQDPDCVRSTILTSRSMAVAVTVFILLFGLINDESSKLLTSLTSVVSLLFWCILNLLRRSDNENVNDSPMNFVLFLNVGLVLFELTNILQKVGILR